MSDLLAGGNSRIGKVCNSKGLGSLVADKQCVALQVKSTVAMQALQPKIKEIQERYKGKDQQEMQIQVGQLYKDAGVNPLAGCLPTLATLPVWIGLYRYALSRSPQNAQA